MPYTKGSRDRIHPAAVAFLLLILVIASTTAIAQKRKLIGGSLNGLKGQKSYDIQFTYDNMLVGDGMPENQYLAQKSRDWEVKEPGKGPAFVAQWFDSRQVRYEPTFIKSFEGYSRIKLKDKNAKYTLVLKTKRTEGGWDFGIATHSGEIAGEMWIVESADQSNVIAKIGFSDLIGNVAFGGDFDMPRRIQSAYGFAGKALGDFLKRKAR
jgi:hypothetical protein